jgi:hypothetical protein
LSERCEEEEEDEEDADERRAFAYAHMRNMPDMSWMSE